MQKSSQAQGNHKNMVSKCGFVI